MCHNYNDHITLKPITVISLQMKKQKHFKHQTQTDTHICVYIYIYVLSGGVTTEY